MVGHGGRRNSRAKREISTCESEGETSRPHSFDDGGENMKHLKVEALKEKSANSARGMEKGDGSSGGESDFVLKGQVWGVKTKGGGVGNTKRGGLRYT